MKRTASGRVSAPTRHTFALHATAAALVGVGLLTIGPVFAQQVASEKDAQAKEDAVSAVVTVSGTRQAMQSAQNIKKNAEQVLDSIVADDIGKFPDKNVAEILGRVTGVQIQRGAGEAGSVVIRGLGGITTLYNGREMFTAAGRSLFLADVPATMLQRVDVYKSQGADMVEGGTSGVIDVRTFRPFDFKGEQMAVSGRAENRDKAGKTDPNVSGLWSNRWKTSIGEVGLLGGVSYQRGRYHDEVAWASPPVTLANNIIGMDTMGRVMGAGDRKRLAANFAAQWRPSKDMLVYAEGFSTKIDHDSQSVFFVGGLPAFDPKSTITKIAGGNYVDTISNPSANTFTLSSTQARRDWSKGNQGAFGLNWAVSPALRVTSEFARTVSTYRQENPILDTVQDMAKSVVGSVRDGGGFLEYPGTDMTDPKNWHLFALFDNHNHANGAANDWRADATWTPAGEGLVKSITGGVRLAQRDASYAHELNGWTPAMDKNGVNVQWGSGAIPVTTVPGLTCKSPETGGNYGMNQFYAPCMSYLLDNTDAVRKAMNTVAKPDDPLSFYSDRETTTALYGKANIGFDVFSIPVDGTAGVRVVRSGQKINGFNRDPNGVKEPTPVAVDTTGTDVLPSLNLRAYFREDLIGRVVAGKAIERAAFGDFNPGMTLFSKTDTTPANGTAGNPNLKPQEGRNLDVALEWYFAPAGSLTGTVFYHDFKNFLRRKSQPETIQGVTYSISRPYNAVQGNLRGFEAAYQQFFTNLPDWMKGLGMQANFTYMDGGLEEPDGTINTFPGMSKMSYNLVGLYERGPWSARVAYNWRDKFVAEYDYRALTPSINLIVDPLRTLDASVSYKINKELTLTLDGTNLLDQAYHDYHGVPQMPRDVRRYDRVIGLALSWKM
jgi:TonB-dependent receptor